MTIMINNKKKRKNQRERKRSKKMKTEPEEVVETSESVVSLPSSAGLSPLASREHESEDRMVI